MSQQAAALLTQTASNDDASILTPRVILPPPPVFNVDVPGDYKDDAKDRSIDSSVALSDGTSIRGGMLINGKETTRAGNIDGEYAEGEYPPLPDNYSFNHSATRGGDDDDNLEVPIDDLTDAQASLIFQTFGPLFEWELY